jgi:hypothetical protein
MHLRLVSFAKHSHQTFGRVSEKEEESDQTSRLASKTVRNDVASQAKFKLQWSSSKCAVPDNVENMMFVS